MCSKKCGQERSSTAGAAYGIIPVPMKRTIQLILFALALCCTADATAAKKGKKTGPCRINIPIPAHALYKPTNEHGGRGPTLITSYGNTVQWPPCGSLNIYNKNGANIGRFGCYDAGHLPWGRRFYTGAPGGSFTLASGLYKGAKRADSTNIFIDALGARKSTCWIVNNPFTRQGGI